MKIQTKTLLIACLGLGFFSLASAVKAEDYNTQIDVNIASGGIRLEQPKKISFNATLNGKDQVISDSNASKIVVSDLRGTTNTGWSLSAKVVKTSEAFKGMSLLLNPSSEAKYINLFSSTLSTEEQAVASVSKDQMKSEAIKTDINLNAQLAVPKETVAGNQSNTIIWNIAESPEQ